MNTVLPFASPVSTRSFGFGTSHIELYRYAGQGYGLRIWDLVPRKERLTLHIKTLAELKHLHALPYCALRFYVGTNIDYFVAYLERDEQAIIAKIDPAAYFLYFAYKSSWYRPAFVDYEVSYATKAEAEAAAKKASNITCDVQPVTGLVAKTVRLKCLNHRAFHHNGKWET